MCGIVGILDLDTGKVENSLLKAMTDVLRHRGPDGEGFHINGQIGLGHRRLTVIDLETGKQPMSNEDKTIWITYNGEIYNFQEIRKDLEKKGHQFKTRSDTEVILHAYEEYEHGCLRLFRGMFAFGLWDSRKKQLLVARDRIGKKPVYYYFNGRKFIFASEIKAILQDRSVKKEIDWDAFVDYFVYHYIPFPKSIFKNIYKVSPAHFLIVRLVKRMDGSAITTKITGSGASGFECIQEQRACSQPDACCTISPSVEHLELSTHPYWDLEFNPDIRLSESDWIEGLKEKIRESVRLRLVSDVPLGAFLSGGIDSSTIVAMMASLCLEPPKTFSVGFKEKGFDELQYSRTIAKRFETDHHEFIVTPDAIETLHALSWAFDEPFADSSAIPTYYVSKIARKHVTVILSGDGGDETFAGYDRYQVALYFKKLDFIPLAVRRIIFGALSAMLPMGLKGKGTLRNLSRPRFNRSAGTRTFDGLGYLKKLFNPDLFHDALKKCTSSNNDYPFLKQFYDHYPHADYLSRLQYEDIKTYLAEDIMAKVDRASMLCSLETRSPFLDHELLEYAARIPASLQIKNREKK
ncbi:MAG: asparagine synthase (glutamine-hydrolyzing), partial [Candidatus Hodarchaeota archaeon]